MADSRKLESLLKDVRNQFLTDVNAKYIASDTRFGGIIPGEIETEIKEARSRKNANDILFTHLYNQAIPPDLDSLSSIMIGAEGYRKMQAFGKELHDKMVAEGILKEENLQRVAERPSSHPPQEPPGTHPPADGEDILGPVAEDALLDPTMKRITDMLLARYLTRPGNEAAMEMSFGQRCVPFYKQPEIASAVCRIVWSFENAGKIHTIYGSGSFVSCNGKLYLLTCCHNFLSKEDGDKLKELGDDYILANVKAGCQGAQYLCSTEDFKGTVALQASAVLRNHKYPVLIFDKVHDLLAVEVKDPAGFKSPEGDAKLLPIQPIALDPDVDTKKLLDSAVLLSIVQFPCEDPRRVADCVDFAIGLRLRLAVCQDTQVVYAVDTYKGSSGSPVLFVNEGKVVLLAVHRKSTTVTTKDGSGVRSSFGYNVGSVLTKEFLEQL